MTINVSSAVGFIALFGVAVQNGVIMVSALNRARDSACPCPGRSARGQRTTALGAHDRRGGHRGPVASGHGSRHRFGRATSAGHGGGGGLVSATLLTLAILPVLYLTVERHFQPTKEG